MFLVALISLAALVVALVAIVQLGAIRIRIHQLETLLRRSGPTEDRPLTTAAPIAPPPLPQSTPKPPPLPVASPRPVTSTAPRAPINWESFVGVRMFAWIGGLALFLGVVFFVKYAFENNLISPRIRILTGGFAGLILIALGVLPALRRYRIPAQSLIATGILICYADIYAACSFYGLIPFVAACALMWLVTALALGLAAGLDAPAILWLGVIGGFLTPFLFRATYQNPVALFGYVGVLTCGIAAVSTLKRWPYFMVVAAIGTVVVEFGWVAEFFNYIDPPTARVVFLVFQGLFLLISVALVGANRGNNWNLVAAAIAGFAAMLGYDANNLANLGSWDFGLATPLLAVAGLVILTAVHQRTRNGSKTPAVLIAIALGLTCFGEWAWWHRIFDPPPFGISSDAELFVAFQMAKVAAWHIAIFLLFVAVPFICGPKRTWPWIISAIAGPPQFWFVYRDLTQLAGIEPGRPVVLPPWEWLIPLCFTVPAVAGILYLVRREKVALASDDPRLASQGAAIVTFISLVFPVQFHHEWITLGWAIEGLGLIILFRWMPNRRLRVAALIVFCAAFIRLALNPAVLHYHHRTHAPIFNWYLYAYGIAGLCLLAGAKWFGNVREREYERIGPPLLYILSGIVFFLLLNIEIADYFSVGPTLIFSFAGNFARDMTYTISWALFAFGLLVLGMLKPVRPLRFAAVGLLCVALAKLFLHDLDNLNQLYRIAAFITVAIIAIVASFAYQRFLSATAKRQAAPRL